VSSLVGPSPVDADGGSVVFTSCSSRRRCSSYVVSSMLARLPAAGMGCLASSPSCPIYSLGSETRSRCMQCSLRLSAEMIGDARRGRAVGSDLTEHCGLAGLRELWAPRRPPASMRAVELSTLH